MRYKIITAMIFGFSVNLFAQSDTIKLFTFQGYGELYYSHDFGNPKSHEKPNFMYNHKRDNELNVNLAYVKTSYNKGYVRANAALMAGNYPQYNYSSEPAWAQFIYEANIGFKLSSTKNIWLDAGIIPSHIGFESAVSADCWTLSRSILAENSPFYESGIKLSYTSQSEKLYAAFFVLNGWQRIQKPDYINKPSFGLQFNYKPNPKLTLNYSNYIGTDKNDSIDSWRLYHNLYAIYEPSKKLGIIAGLDIGTDKYNAFEYGVWYSPVLIFRYRPKEKYSIALRGEYYADSKQILIATNTPNGFQVFGCSSNFDIQIKDNVLWRIEAKEYFSEDAIFNSNEKSYYSITTSLSVKL